MPEVVLDNTLQSVSVDDQSWTYPVYTLPDFILPQYVYAVSYFLRLESLISCGIALFFRMQIFVLHAKPFPAKVLQKRGDMQTYESVAPHYPPPLMMYQHATRCRALTLSLQL